MIVLLGYIIVEHVRVRERPEGPCVQIRGRHRVDDATDASIHWREPDVRRSREDRGVVVDVVFNIVNQLHG